MNLAMKLLSEASQRLDLPADVAAGIPRIELLGNREFSMEPHGGLLEYQEDRISVGSALGPVEVCGSKLTIRIMNRERITVSGLISSVLLRGGEHG